jgi:DNA replication and repair protein RecF
LISFGKDHFFIEIVGQDIQTDEAHTISVGCDGEKKVIKFDGKNVRAHKDLLEKYRVLGLTESDLDLISGAPLQRRTFLNHAQMLFDVHFVERMRAYRRSINQRNALLFSLKGMPTTLSLQNKHQLNVWTKNVWEQGKAEIRRFKEALFLLEEKVNELLQRHCPSDQLKITLTYEPEFLREDETFDEFWDRYTETLLAEELRQGRGLWGLHVDDFSISLVDKVMRRFASRGQQKLAILLLKVAQLYLLGQGTAIFIVDDFMTDFDARRIHQVLQILRETKTQIIMTTPLQFYVPADFAGIVQLIEIDEKR